MWSYLTVLNPFLTFSFHFADVVFSQSEFVERIPTRPVRYMKVEPCHPAAACACWGWVRARGFRQYTLIGSCKAADIWFRNHLYFIVEHTLLCWPLIGWTTAHRSPMVTVRYKKKDWNLNVKDLVPLVIIMWLWLWRAKWKESPFLVFLKILFLHNWWLIIDIIKLPYHKDLTIAWSRTNSLQSCNATHKGNVFEIKYLIYN